MFILLFRFLWLILDPNEAHQCRHEIQCGKHTIYLYNHGPLAGVEEILKHKTSSSYSAYNFKKFGQDEVEAARMAAINKEIKRVLTEVLLKVSDDLFNEIATKVMNEDDSSAEPNEITGVSSSKKLGLGESEVKTTAVLVVLMIPG
uniref:Uncharacterized protein n=1 Tax=Triticum urartu TaxID=4572 RepID=A0A8R7USJ7_TRIUA